MQDNYLSRLKLHINNLLVKYGELNDESTQKILSNDNLLLFRKAMTTYLYDNKDNGQFYEILGDSVLNHAIINLIRNKRRDFFDDEKRTNVKIMSKVDVLGRLKILYVKKKFFASLADKLELTQFLRKKIYTQEEKDSYSRAVEEKKSGKKINFDFAYYKDLASSSTREDLFESFFGALEEIIDKEYYFCAYGTIYKILEKIFEDITIKIDIRIIYEPKSLYNTFGRQIVSCVYPTDPAKEFIKLHDKTGNINLIIPTLANTENKQKQEIEQEIMGEVVKKGGMMDVIKTCAEHGISFISTRTYNGIEYRMQSRDVSGKYVVDLNNSLFSFDEMIKFFSLLLTQQQVGNIRGFGLGKLSPFVDPMYEEN